MQRSADQISFFGIPRLSKNRPKVVLSNCSKILLLKNVSSATILAQIFVVKTPYRSIAVCFLKVVMTPMKAMKSTGASGFADSAPPLQGVPHQGNETAIPSSGADGCVNKRGSSWYQHNAIELSSRRNDYLQQNCTDQDDHRSDYAGRVFHGDLARGYDAPQVAWRPQFVPLGPFEEPQFVESCDIDGLITMYAPTVLEDESVISSFVSEKVYIAQMCNDQQVTFNAAQPAALDFGNG